MCSLCVRVNFKTTTALLSALLYYYHIKSELLSITLHDGYRYDDCNVGTSRGCCISDDDFLFTNRGVLVLADFLRQVDLLSRAGTEKNSNRDSEFRLSPLFTKTQLSQWWRKMRNMIESNHTKHIAFIKSFYVLCHSLHPSLLMLLAITGNGGRSERSSSKPTQQRSSADDEPYCRVDSR